MSNPNLMLHCGAAAVDRADLSEVVLPPVTRTYMPIGHDVFLNMVEAQMAEVGFTFGNQAHGLTKDGDRYFGLVELQNCADSESHALVMGIRNSLDKKFPASVAFGSQVFVCDNLAFTGSEVVARKHTTNIMRDLPDLIKTAVGRTATYRDNQNARFEVYQEHMLSDLRAHDLIIKMLQCGAINTSRVAKVVEQWHNPDHDFGGKTIWRLFNAVTEALKGAPLADMPRRTIEMQRVMDVQSGYVNQYEMA